MSKKVSVLIPVYNAERYVAAALDSVLAQSWPDIEVIAVNDGSTDESRAVLARYEGRIKVIDQENLGQCAAANRAYAASSGGLIKFFDADDIMDPDMIKRQVQRLGARRDAVALGEWTRFYGETPAGECFPTLPMYRDAKPVDWLTAEWTTSLPMMQCGLWLIPRRIVESAGLWNEQLSLINDFEYFTRLLIASEDILFVPGARLYYRSGVNGNLSGRRSRQAIESQLQALILGADHLLSAEESARTRRACANILQHFEFEHYPSHPDLRAIARQKIAALGGADIAPTGPPTFQRLRRLIGWRLARYVQRAAGR